jgi:hypothetical protein
MKARKILEYIRSELEELEAHAHAGGNREYAFDLCIDEKELYAAFKLLNDQTDRIAAELDREDD